MSKSQILALSKILPTSLLDLTKSQVQDLVKKESSEELHEKYTRLMAFVEMFAPAVKGEIVDRLKKQIKKAGDKSIVTPLGEITLVRKSNTTIDEFSLKKYLRRKRTLGIEAVFEDKYELVTQNKKVLLQLEEKGLVNKTLVLNKTKYAQLKKEHPEFSDFEEDSPTYYLRGL